MRIGQSGIPPGALASQGFNFRMPGSSAERSSRGVGKDPGGRFNGL
jgi:hypothetical protein